MKQPSIRPTSSRARTIATVTVWGAVANLVLSVLKMVAGLVGHSAAMTADAVHSLSDLVSDVVVLVMVRVAGRERDDGHDYGHGKFETLATMAVSLLLLVVGGKLMAGAVDRIRYVIDGGTLAAPGTIALWAALVSVAVKELLYQWTARIGRRVDSPAMVANAWHHRSDALSSVGSALGIGGAIVLGQRWTILDPIVGAVISVVILVVAVKMALPALGELTDASLSDDVEADIARRIQSVPGVDDVHALKTRRTGPDIIVDAHIVVNPNMTVAEAHHIATQAENAVKDEYGVGTQLSIHVEPDVEAD